MAKWRNRNTNGLEHSSDVPDMEELEEWMNDSYCNTPICECAVEPDGVCEHGRPSWFLVLGLI